MASFAPACETTTRTLRSADLRVRGCRPSAQGQSFSKRFLNSVNSLKIGRLASVPALRSMCFCCPVPHCLTTWSHVDRKNSQAPLNTLQHLWQLANAVAPFQPNPAWSFSSLFVFGSAIRSIRRILYHCYRRAPSICTSHQATLRHLRWLLLLTLSN